MSWISRVSNKVLRKVLGNVPRNNKYDSFLKMATGCNDDLNEDMLQPHGSFMAEEENLNIKMMNDLMEESRTHAKNMAN